MERGRQERGLGGYCCLMSELITRVLKLAIQVNSRSPEIVVCVLLTSNSERCRRCCRFAGGSQGERGWEQEELDMRVWAR